MKNLKGLEVLSVEAQTNIKGGFGKYAPSEIPTNLDTNSNTIIFPKSGKSSKDNR